MAAPFPRHKPGLEVSRNPIHTLLAGDADTAKSDHRKLDLIKRLEEGVELAHFNYDDSCRTLRYVKLSLDNTVQVLDRNSRAIVMQRPLQGAAGMVLGPRTTTFRRRARGRGAAGGRAQDANGRYYYDPDWLCFSVIFSDGTLDFAALVDKDVETMFLGLQYAYLGLDVCETMTRSRLLLTKARFKLTAACEAGGCDLRELMDAALKARPLPAPPPQSVDAEPETPRDADSAAGAATRTPEQQAEFERVEAERKERERRERMLADGAFFKGGGASS